MTEKKDSDGPSNAKLSIAVGTGIVSGAGVYKATESTPLAILVTALMVAPSAWERLSGQIKKRFEGLAALWSAEAEAQLPPPGEERDRAVEESSGVLIEHLQLLMRAIDPAVVPALGRLAAPYLAGAKPDEFFRGATRMISDFSEAGLVEAQRIFHATWGIPPTSEHVFLSALGTPPRVFWSESKVLSNKDWKVRVEGGFADPARVLRALQLAGLADSDVPGSADLMVGPWIIAMSRATAARLAKVLGPPSGEIPPASPDEPPADPVEPPSVRGPNDPE